MSVFVSFAEEDRDFAEMICRSLMMQRIHVFIDRWHISVGSELNENILRELDEAEYIILVLSNSSSETIRTRKNRWLTREYELALSREAREKRKIILPVVIEDCIIPIEIENKLFANFSNQSFEKAFSNLMIPLSQLLNDKSGRFVLDREFFTDFSIDWGTDDESKELIIRLNFIEFSREFEWSVLTIVTISCNRHYYSSFQNDLAKGQNDVLVNQVLNICGKSIVKYKDSSILVSVRNSVTKSYSFKQNSIHMLVTSRKMGNDQGYDYLIHLPKYLNQINAFRSDRKNKQASY